MKKIDCLVSKDLTCISDIELMECSRYQRWCGSQELSVSSQGGDVTII